MEEKDKELEAIRRATNDQSTVIVDENDTFGFTCQQCGRCCMHRGDIILNPFDIYNGAKYLGITTQEFMDKYTNVTLGANSKIPMVVLSSASNGYCPLLKLDVKDGGKFKCTINPAKPGACSNHPIGVAYAKNIKTGEKKLQYIKVDQCPNSKSDEMHVVKDWVKPYTDHMDEINKAHELQHLVTDYVNTRTFFYLMDILISHDLVNEENGEELHQEEIVSVIGGLARSYINATINLGYVEYDINKPFIEQADENINKLETIYTDIAVVYNKLKATFEKAFDGRNIDDVLKEILEENSEEDKEGEE